MIASLNGVTRSGWVNYARLLQEAGADAIELNVYFIPADLSLTRAATSSSSMSTCSRRSNARSASRSR